MIGLIWVGGAILAILLYVTGPDRFLAACFDFLDLLDAAFRNLLFTMGARVGDVVRAAAIAVYIVFVILAILVARQGHRAGWTLLIVTVAMWLLVWRPAPMVYVPVGRWFAALVLGVIAALAMTRRLLGPPPQPPRDRSWPPFRPPA
jgi:hypothetical protein